MTRKSVNPSNCGEYFELVKSIDLPQAEKEMDQTRCALILVTTSTKIYQRVMVFSKINESN